MAKLTGVKTIDMVNGEITKVEYAGEVYVKIEGNAQVGDLIKTDGSWSDATDGAFYKCVELDHDGDARIVDDVGDKDASFRFHYEVFRKQSATPSSSLDERVTTLEKRVDTLEKGEGKSEGQFRKVTDRKPKAGDFVKFLKTDDDDLTIGKYYEVKDIDMDGDLMITDDNGDGSYAMYNDEVFEIYEKVDSKPTPEPLKVGDYAKIISNDFGNRFVIGEIIKLVDKHTETGFKAENLDGPDYWYVSNVEVVRATDEEVAEAKAKLHKASFKVGDNVKLTIAEGGYPRHGFGSVRNGDVGTIAGINGERIKINFPKQSGWNGYLDEITKVSDEEVEQLKAAEKWAKLGRQPNEFKKGDIVRVTDDVYGSGHAIGTIGVIDYDSSLGKLRVFANGKFKSHNRSSELIAPVESRFDGSDE